jgi:hypothetical protein
MNARRYHNRLWASAALLALGHAAIAQDSPVAAPNNNSISAAPAVALTPVPMSEYVQQQPPPPLTSSATPAVEQAGFAPATLSAPSNNVPFAATSAQTMPVSMQTQASPYRTGPTFPGIGSLAAPTWRWYGWGAATPQGFASSQTPAPPLASSPNTVLPPPTMLNPSAPSTPPSSNPPAPTPPAPGDVPKVNVPVVPMMEPIGQPSLSPAVATPAVAPPVAAPTIDMTPAPKMVPAPATTGPAVDPWTGTSQPGAKAAVEWRTVRASSAK